MLRLTLVRHGITEWNRLGRWQGHTDTELSPEGERQARQLGRRWQGRRFDRVYSSDLRRAHRTAELALPDAEIILEPRLREVSFGEFDGKTEQENRLHPLFADWAADPYRSPAPGGESLEDLLIRLLPWVSELEDGLDVVAFSHSCTLRTLISHLVRLPMEPREGRIWPFVITTPHTSVSVLERSGSDWSLVRLADDAHLEPAFAPQETPA
ncbi:broad specificity phosphatase PhoE [Deinobacterium chartae]|uniref:Broad specificity phosphatase PhoE n=1 Tax=Deinobacterium chartae TaxID=521158 RepID=A0A841I724_9DEIO|nr:histidine phosphatase family protein [Deinobacterium chartae]MBB6099625.1 broad specificity phosphatase PhoE [Deinobacterium chartae]